MVEFFTICKTKIWFPFMKSHYFIFNAAMVGVLPFIQVLGKQLGISAISMGIIFTALPFLNLLAKPLLGWFADYTKSLKNISYYIMLLLSFSCFVVNFIERDDHSVNGHISCGSDGTTFSYWNLTDPECSGNITAGKEYYCFMRCWECPAPNDVSKNETTEGHCKVGRYVPSSMFVQRNRSYPTGVFVVNKLQIDASDMVVSCAMAVDFDCEVTCPPEMHDCYDENKDSGTNIINAVSYVILVVFISCFSGIITTLGDTICFSLLGDRAHLYGRQRLWGTVGWGVFSAIVGALNSYLTGPSFLQNYSFGFATAAFLLVWNVFVLMQINTDNVTFSKNIWQDVGKLLKEVNVIFFLISVFVMGALTGVLWTFFYWHLTMINASVLLLGLVNTVETLVGELPFFYFASKILNKIGHFNTMTLCFIAFGVRYILVSYITDPWWILPVEILQGPTYGLFYTAMASFANTAALPGTKATMQGLVGGVFEGLGLATGSFFGGLVMHRYQGHWLFFGAGIAALCYSVVNILFTLWLSEMKKREAERARRAKRESPDEQTNFL